ncbi:HTH-type transcriptional repressor YvoA [bioreactor metagenome]|uniref:HTH-type transcriptional repressor YvoA n=1 Tax=bioreactor metagenome TaxID=1076179 RepID=A0A645BHL1_9ZZZZ|nr:GntR family transcriptional regulator [Erysipelotrichaceae bacterium]
MKETAKYKTIENYIINQIENGELRVGDQILTEYQLSAKFKIGRLTVNKALINLAKEGYIKRIAGKGSFVTSRTVIRDFFTRRSFTEDMESIGLKAGSLLLEYKLYTGNEVPKIAHLLSLKPDDKIHYFHRLRTGDDEPIAISYTYIPKKIIADFDLTALNHSLNEYFKSLGIIDGGFKQKMTAHLPTAEQKELLKLDHEALLRSAHIRYTSEGLPYEYTETYYRSDKFEYTFDSGINVREELKKEQNNE